MKAGAQSAQQRYNTARQLRRKKYRGGGGNGLGLGVTLDDFFAYMIEHKYIFARPASCGRHQASTRAFRRSS